MPDTPSHFIWYELMASNPEQAAKFYGDVLGWTVEDSGQEGMAYSMWSSGSERVGGMLEITPDMAVSGVEDNWIGYVDVADVDASVAAIMAAGGHSHMVQDVPGVGRMAMVSDPQGAMFYVMTPAPTAEGTSTAFAQGVVGHGGWNELHTTDAAAAYAFYEEELGWKTSEIFDMGAMGPYRTFNAGAGPIGGMMNNPNFPRPAWLYYFNVDEIDAGKARVEAAGGTVTAGPHQVPGGLWMIQARDPRGAVFALLAPTKG